MSALLNLQSKDLRQLLRHLTSSSQLLGSPVFFENQSKSNYKIPHPFFLQHFAFGNGKHTHINPFPVNLKSTIHGLQVDVCFWKLKTKPNQIKSQQKKDPNPQSNRLWTQVPSLQCDSTSFNLGKVRTRDLNKEFSKLFRAFQRDGWFFFLSLLVACWSPKNLLISVGFYLFLFQWRNFHCKKIARSQHLAKCRVFFCPIWWATKTHKPISQHPSFATTNKIWTTSNIQDLSVVVLLLLVVVVVVVVVLLLLLLLVVVVVVPCSLLLVASWFLVAPLILGEPQLFMAVAVEIAIDLHHTLVKPRVRMLSRGWIRWFVPRGIGYLSWDFF